MFKVKQDKKAWEAGFNAGLRGEQSTPPEGVEVLGWSSGYIEGKAAAEKTRRSQEGNFETK